MTLNFALMIFTGKQEGIRWPSPRGAGPAKRSCYHINVDSTFLEDGLTDHDKTFRDYGGEYPRCDDVIDHTIYLLLIDRSYAGGALKG